MASKLRIVLLGKTGAGKSSSGNTILGRKAFDVSPTEQSQEETGEFDGQTLAVVDTPGLFNSRLTEEQVKKEIRKCISLADPGTCVFLVVIHAGRFTKEEQKAVKIIQQMFGEEAADHTMVLFTCGDDVDADGGSIDTIISDNLALQDFIKQCYGEFYIFNNRKNDCSQVRELLQKINTMVQNRGKRNLTNEMFKEARKEEDIRLPRGPRFDQANPAPGGDTILKAELRIVLLGKTGAGKSSSGNTILRRRAFDMSPTEQSQEETGEFDGQTLAVVDTPGLFNSRLTEEQVKKEIRKCISLPASGPLVCLVVIHAGRFTKEEQETVKIIQQILEKAAGGYMMVLFTRGDDLEADGITISKIINDDQALHDFIKCCGEFHIFNNRNMDHSQVRELLKKINTMVQRNRGTCDSSEMFSEAQLEIEEGREDKKRTHTRTSEMPFDVPKRRLHRENLSIQSNTDGDRAAAFGGTGFGVGDVEF